MARAPRLLQGVETSRSREGACGSGFDDFLPVMEGEGAGPGWAQKSCFRGVLEEHPGNARRGSWAEKRKNSDAQDTGS